MPSTDQIVKLLNSGGVLGLLVLVLVGGYKQWWVWGWLYTAHSNELQKQLDQMTNERNQWRDLSLRYANVAEGAISAVKKEQPPLWNQ
jgi:hypothetical protein